jgi:NAD(P)-dependent dehydrogenase (short-subunit alcohol dehydrogenase family)
LCEASLEGTRNAAALSFTAVTAITSSLLDKLIREMILDGQIAAVTGASRGLGRAIALRLAAQGAAVAVIYISRTAEAESVVDQIKSAGGRATAFSADVGDRSRIERTLGEISAQLGDVSILVNNAGVAWRATLETFDPVGMERMRRTNVDGLIQMTHFAAQRMKACGYGRIVNISTIAGHGTALPGNAFYAATKAAVSILTKRFAMELGPFGITVNAVAPGFIQTDMVKDGRTEAEYQAMLKHISEVSMVGHAGTPEDIANAVAFLASPESGFITAQVFTVDGGRMDYIGHP